ncbi:MAG: ATP-binding protein [Acidobacteriota bacterium]|nr:MAG: ATP-binding protein [Acidobacteriota bacterium]
MSLKPWREVATPHQDVLKGTFQQAEFAADLSRVHDATASEEYQNPELFFQRTFITEGMRLLLDSVVKRLTGRGGDPVIQLQTAFGGGKTHTMLAVYHLAKGEAPTSKLAGIPPILDAANVTELPRARVVVIDGNNQAPGQPKKRGRHKINTLWGELAWQLGGESGYEIVKEADLSGTSPGKDVLAQLLGEYAPCVILIDELVAYIRQFEEGKALPGGTFDSNLSFVQALTEGIKAVPNAIILASLPESEKEAGSQRGVSALRSLEHYFARVQALWKPVATEEAFEIVRRRLFSKMTDRSSVEEVCRAFADYYIANGSDFPHETQESRYYDRLLNAYPIHPEVFDRLYEDWSTLDNFQRTRGVLKLMAKVIHRLWKDGNNDLMIMPGSLPLYDADTRNEAIYYLPQGWDPVLEGDIDGERAETTEIENQDTRFGSLQACRRAARTIFLGSAPTTRAQMVRGVELERIILGSAQAGQQVGVFRDAMRRLTDRLHYLNSANNRFWFDTRANLRREMEERKRRYDRMADVFPLIRSTLQRTLNHGIFTGTHIFTSSGDIPDDFGLRLVVLAPDAAYSRTPGSQAIERANEILKNRGDQPRQKQNRLIFLVADHDSVGRLDDQARSVLAWQSIVDDVKEMRLILDQLQAKQASKSADEAAKALQRMVREAYKYLLVPGQVANARKGVSEIEWEKVSINPGAQNLTLEIERALQDGAMLISEWSPIHLRDLLRTWFWKDGATEVGAADVWQKTCQYLYMPRLKNEDVFRKTLAAGAGSRDFFGFAYGREEEAYRGFSFGQPASPLLDNSLLLIETATAAACDEKLRAAEAPKKGASDQPPSGPEGGNVRVEDSPISPPKPSIKRRFYAIKELDPVKAKLDFSQIVDEVLLQFTQRPDARVEIKIEINAQSDKGFDDQLQRAVKENCSVLKFKSSEFE